MTLAATETFTNAATAAAINNWQAAAMMTLAATMATIAAVIEAYKLAAKAAAINDFGSDNGNDSSSDRGIYSGSKSCSYQ